MNPLYKSDTLRVLQQVRPYIQADGGDVELVDIADNGVVFVRLTGNCIGCASAGVTIFDGIQAALQGQLTWVTRVEQVEDDRPVSGSTGKESPMEFIEQMHRTARQHLQDLLNALEELQVGQGLPDAVPAFIDLARGELSQLLRLEEEVLYGAAESFLGLTSGPTAMLKKEHEQLHRMFTDFTAMVVRFGGQGGPGPRELREAAQRMARYFEQHLQKEQSVLLDALNRALPDDLRNELKEDIQRHAGRIGLKLASATTKAQP